MVVEKQYYRQDPYKSAQGTIEGNLPSKSSKRINTADVDVLGMLRIRQEF